MQELFFLVLIVWAVAASGVGIYFKLEAQKWKGKYEMTDFETLGEEYGLKVVGNEREIPRREFDQAYNAEEMARNTLESMKAEFVRHLVDHGFIRVEKSDVPSRPAVRFRMRIMACNDAPQPVGEPIGLFLDRKKRPVGTGR